MKRLLAFNLLALATVGAHADVAAPTPAPREITSFGACVSDGHVYVYGGHTGEAHQHSKDNLSPDFIRLPLDQPGAAWEKLPEDQAVQGTALVAWKGLVVRIGGMYATNAADEDAVMFSTDAVRCYDPEAKAWSDWPSLPGKVSSHDALVMDDVLYVVGGWKLDGKNKGVWHEHGWSLDLNDRDQGWQDLPPMPATRRAGTVAAAGGEIWWVGGMGGKGGASGSVFAYDPKKKRWREGPDLLAVSRIKAFGSSTFSVGGRLFNSGMDGVLHSLDPADGEWAATAVSHRHGRIFHRSLPVGDGMFWTIAGASRKGHRSDIEVLPIPEQAPVASSATAWQSFRGGSNNEFADREMAESWSDDANIAWKVALPGYGQSTPVFGQGGIYVTSAITAEAAEAPDPSDKPVAPAPAQTAGDQPAAPAPEGRRRGRGGRDGASTESIVAAANGPMKTEIAVTRIDQRTGAIAWTAALPSSSPEPSNKYRSCAAPTPCLDERAVYAWFESGDLVALDHRGETLWHRQIGKEHGPPQGNHGLGGSLVQDRDSLYLLVDHDGPSYLLCLDKEKGEARWKVDREKRVSWSTPVVTDDAVIVSSNGLVEEFDKASGERRWMVDGLEGNTVASPLVFRDYVLAPSSAQGQTQLIRRGQSGQGGERVVWKADGKTAASFSSPVFARGQIVLVSKAGIASGLDWRSGEELWSHRLPAGCWATPAVLGGRIHFFSTTGATLVAELTDEGLRELRTNELSVGASKVYGAIPAGDRWIVRTGEEVVAIAKPEGGEEPATAAKPEKS